MIKLVFSFIFLIGGVLLGLYISSTMGPVAFPVYVACGAYGLLVAVILNCTYMGEGYRETVGDIFKRIGVFVFFSLAIALLADIFINYNDGGYFFYKFDMGVDYRILSFIGVEPAFIGHNSPEFMSAARLFLSDKITGVTISEEQYKLYSLVGFLVFMIIAMSILYFYDQARRISSIIIGGLACLLLIPAISVIVSIIVGILLALWLASFMMKGESNSDREQRDSAGDAWREQRERSKEQSVKDAQAALVRSRGY